MADAVLESEYTMASVTAVENDSDLSGINLLEIEVQLVNCSYPKTTENI